MICYEFWGVELRWDVAWVGMGGVVLGLLGGVGVGVE